MAPALCESAWTKSKRAIIHLLEKFPLKKKVARVKPGQQL
jgi:hypothetical protein